MPSKPRKRHIVSVVMRSPDREILERAAAAAEKTLSRYAAKAIIERAIDDLSQPTTTGETNE